MKKNIRLIAVFAFVSAILLIWYFLYPKKSENHQGKLEKVTVGTISHETLSLLYIAQNKGYFLDNGIDLLVKPYTIASDSFRDFFLGTTDMITVTEFFAVGKYFERQDFKIIGSLDEGKINSVVGRRDHGIEKIADLKNKRIGVTFGLSSEFSFAVFLLKNGINVSDVRILNLGRDEIVEQLSSGKIDAGVIWDPFVQKIESNLGKNGIIFSAPFDRDFSMLLLGRDDFIKTRPETIEKFIKALVQAEKFAQENPIEAKKIMIKKLGYKKEYLDSVWSHHTYSVTLEQSLLLMMEYEARWVIKNKLTEKTEVPNYLNFLYFEGLKKVNPESVGVIH